MCRFHLWKKNLEVWTSLNFIFNFLHNAFAWKQGAAYNFHIGSNIHAVCSILTVWIYCFGAYHLPAWTLLVLLCWSHKTFMWGGLYEASWTAAMPLKQSCWNHDTRRKETSLLSEYDQSHLTLAYVYRTYFQSFHYATEEMPLKLDRNNNIAMTNHMWLNLSHIVYRFSRPPTSSPHFQLKEWHFCYRLRSQFNWDHHTDHCWRMCK